MSERKLSILTERQATAYRLKEGGMTTKQIAAEMGITANMVRAHLKNAEKRFRQHETAERIKEQNDVPVDFALTRADLLVIMSSLQCYTLDMLARINKNIKSDWVGKLPPEYLLAEDLIERIKIALRNTKSLTNPFEQIES